MNGPPHNTAPYDAMELVGYKGYTIHVGIHKAQDVYEVDASIYSDEPPFSWNLEKTFSEDVEASAEGVRSVIEQAKDVVDETIKGRKEIREHVEAAVDTSRGQTDTDNEIAAFTVGMTIGSFFTLIFWLISLV